MSIPIFDDELLESPEAFNVFVEIGGMDTDGAVIELPGITQVIIASDDGKLQNYFECTVAAW